MYQSWRKVHGRTQMSGAGFLVSTPAEGEEDMPILFGGTFGGWAPTDSTTYYLGAPNYDGPLTTETNIANLVSPVTGTIDALYVTAYESGGSATSENVSHTVRVAGVDTTIVASGPYTGTNSASFSDIAHTAAVAAGDKIVIKVVTPAWATNPTGVRVVWSIRITL